MSFNIEDMIDIEENEDILETQDTNTKQKKEENNDVFDMLMSKIPIKSNNTVLKEPKVKAKTNDTKSDTKSDTKDNTYVKEELLPISKYNLSDLQRLSFLYKIDIQKMGTQGKKINKLKAELYEELINAKKYSKF